MNKKSILARMKKNNKSIAKKNKKSITKKKNKINRNTSTLIRNNSWGGMSMNENEENLYGPPAENTQTNPSNMYNRLGYNSNVLGIMARHAVNPSGSAHRLRATSRRLRNISNNSHATNTERQILQDMAQNGIQVVTEDHDLAQYVHSPLLGGNGERIIGALIIPCPKKSFYPLGGHIVYYKGNYYDLDDIIEPEGEGGHRLFNASEEAYSMDVLSKFVEKWKDYI